MVTARLSSTHNQPALFALDQAAAASFDQAEAEGATIQEAITAAQAAVSLAVTSEGEDAAVPPQEVPDFLAIPNLASDDENLLDEMPPAAAQNLH